MTDPTTPAAVDPQQERGGDDAAVGLREELRARLAAHVQPTFRHDGDPTPHPDEAVLVDRLTDNIFLPYELKLRAAVAELEQLWAERDWQPGRWRQVRQPDGSVWMETSDGEEAEAEARKQGWPLYRLWECRETEWRLMVDDTTPQQPEPSDGAR